MVTNHSLRTSAAAMGSCAAPAVWPWILFPDPGSRTDSADAISLLAHPCGCHRLARTRPHPFVRRDWPGQFVFRTAFHSAIEHALPHSQTSFSAVLSAASRHALPAEEVENLVGMVPRSPHGLSPLLDRQTRLSPWGFPLFSPWGFTRRWRSEWHNITRPEALAARAASRFPAQVAGRRPTALRLGVRV